MALSNNMVDRNLTGDQFKKIMNMVHLEGRLEGVHSIKRSLEGSKEVNRLDMEYYKVNRYNLINLIWL